MNITYEQEEFTELEDGFALRNLLTYGEGCMKVLVMEVRHPDGRITRTAGYCCHGEPGMVRPTAELYPEVTHPVT